MMIDTIKNVCAVGAGAMGSGTALCFAMAGYTVKLFDLTDASLAAGLSNIRAALSSYQEHRLISENEIPAILARFKTTTSLSEAAKDADFIIESIIENLEAKRDVFAKLEKICSPQTIFATNTSGLSPTDIADVLEHKGRFVVAHFWNPPHLIPLVEVVPGTHTSQATVDITYDLLTKIGKKPVRLKRESLGFVGNRIQAAALREALHIVESGIASAEDVDMVVQYSLGRRYAETGPLASADLGGLDIFKNIFSYLGVDLCNSTDIPDLLARTVAQGKLGAKTGSGIYPWPADKLAEIKKRREDELFRHREADLKHKKSGSI